MEKNPSWVGFRDTGLYAWLRVAAWCAAIFYLSSRPDYQGHALDLDSWASIFRFIVRKTGHLTEYGILMVLAYAALRRARPRWQSRGFLIAFLFAVLYAGTDEWHQTFIYGRTGTVVDVYIDSVGSLLGYAFYLLGR